MRKIFVIVLIILFLGIFQSLIYKEPLPESEYVDLRVGVLAYDEYGSGDNTLILIHGNPGSKEDFSLLAPEIKNTKVYALDMYCFGESSKNVPNCGALSSAGTVLEFMDSLGIEKSSVLGFSWGGAIAIEFANSYPSRIQDLILLDGSGIQEGEPPGSYFREQAVSYVLYLPTIYYPGSFFGDYRFRKGSIVSYLDTDLRPIEKVLGEINVSTLILHGDNDEVIEPWVAKRHNELLRNSKLVFFEGGHGTGAREVEKIYPEINSFLNNG